MKLSQLQQLPNQRICVYGEPKTGKTELVAKLAEKYNLLWFDLENGFSPLFKLPKEWQERIDLVRVPDTQNYPIAIETMLKVITGSKLLICNEHGKAGCTMCMKSGGATTEVCLKDLANKHDTIVVVDSMTQLANSAMNWIMTKSKDDKPGWPEFRQQGTIMDKFLGDTQQSTWNIVCITHVSEVEQEDGKTKLVPVAGTRNFSRNTAKYFDHVVYCRVANKKHSFGSGTTFDTQALTGSRTDASIEGMEIPSLLPFFDPEVIRDTITKAQATNAAGAAKILQGLKGMVATKV